MFSEARDFIAKSQKEDETCFSKGFSTNCEANENRSENMYIKWYVLKRMKIVHNEHKQPQTTDRKKNGKGMPGHDYYRPDQAIAHSRA